MDFNVTEDKMFVNMISKKRKKQLSETGIRMISPFPTMY